MGTLYLVATPIGNLEDISPRALRILREARLIAAEDTRVTRKLLTHFDLHTPLTSYFEHNKVTKLDSILSSLSYGDVALVSDAGTPAINDPGYELVGAAGWACCLSHPRSVRAAGSPGRLRAAHRHVPLPGLPAAQVV
jgi:16S rRNA (cytidine1402-2'-O)-methyltransferase